jgi:hypothetical protein
MAGLALSIPMLVALPVIAIGFGLEAAELTFIGAGGVAEAVLLWKQSHARTRRGSALAIGRIPVLKLNRLMASMVVDGSVTVLGIGRLVGLVEVAVAAILLGPETDQFHEHGIQQFRSFVPWTDLESFRYVVFENTTIFSFQLREPGWFRREVSVGVPRAEVEPVREYLSRRLPCLGHEDRRRIPAPAT